jgi:hypothetical protein
MTTGIGLRGLPLQMVLSFLSNNTSLPSTWQTFVEPYNGNTNDPNNPDPKWRMSSDALIGLLCEEFKIRMNRANNRNNNGTNGSINLVRTQKATGASKSLEA